MNYGKEIDGIMGEIDELTEDTWRHLREDLTKVRRIVAPLVRRSSRARTGANLLLEQARINARIITYAGHALVRVAQLIEAGIAAEEEEEEEA